MEPFLTGLGNVLLWTVVSLILIFVVLEVFNRRWRLWEEIFGKENNTAAALFAGSFVLGVFYMVTQFIIH